MLLFRADMNNKEFINALATRTDNSQKNTKQLIDSLVRLLADTLEEGDTLAVQSFGTFEVKKKKERIIVNPSSKQRQLVPPKLAISFKPSSVLKEKANA